MLHGCGLLPCLRRDKGEGAAGRADPRVADEPGHAAASSVLGKGAGGAATRRFAWAEIESVTAGFSSRVIGQGGFSTVYLASLSSSRLGAVPPPRLPTGAPRAPLPPPPARRPPARLLRRPRGRRLGVRVRPERRPAREAPRHRRRQAGAPVGAAHGDRVPGGHGAGAPPRDARPGGDPRRHQGLQRAARRQPRRQALRLRIRARRLLRRAPAPVPGGRGVQGLGAPRHGLPGLRRPALPPLRRRHQEERRLQLRRAPPRAPHGEGGHLRRHGVPPGHRGGADAQRRKSSRRGGPEARGRVRHPRGRDRGGARAAVRQRRPRAQAVHGGGGARAAGEDDGADRRRRKQTSRQDGFMSCTLQTVNTIVASVV